MPFLTQHERKILSCGPRTYSTKPACHFKGIETWKEIPQIPGFGHRAVEYLKAETLDSTKKNLSTFSDAASALTRESDYEVASQKSCDSADLENVVKIKEVTCWLKEGGKRDVAELSTNLGQKATFMYTSTAVWVHKKKSSAWSSDGQLVFQCPKIYRACQDYSG